MDMVCLLSTPPTLPGPGADALDREPHVASRQRWPVANQCLGSPKPRSDTPHSRSRDSASSRWWAAKVSTCATIAPYDSTCGRGGEGLDEGLVEAPGRGEERDVVDELRARPGRDGAASRSSTRAPRRRSRSRRRGPPRSTSPSGRSAATAPSAACRRRFPRWSGRRAVEVVVGDQAAPGRRARRRATRGAPPSPRPGPRCPSCAAPAAGGQRAGGSGRRRARRCGTTSARRATPTAARRTPAGRPG